MKLDLYSDAKKVTRNNLIGRGFLAGYFPTTLTIRLIQLYPDSWKKLGQALFMFETYHNALELSAWAAFQFGKVLNVYFKNSPEERGDLLTELNTDKNSIANKLGHVFIARSLQVSALWIGFLASNDRGTFLVHVIPFLIAFGGAKLLGSCETTIANPKDYLQKSLTMMVFNLVDVGETIAVNLGGIENPDDGKSSAYGSITDYKNNPTTGVIVAVGVGVVSPFVMPAIVHALSKIVDMVVGWCHGEPSTCPTWRPNFSGLLGQLSICCNSSKPTSPTINDDNNDGQVYQQMP